MTRPPLTTPTLALVSLGGALGAVLRWGLGELVPDGSGFPWTTFAINLVGSLLLALLPRLARHPHVVHVLGPGLLGGFTTLSAYADQSRALLADGEVVVAAAYLAGTLLACVAAVHLASRLTTPAQRSALHHEEGDE